MLQRSRDSSLAPSIWLGALVIGLILATLWPVLSADFINYDDPIYVTENAVVKEGLSAKGVSWAFTKESAAKINLWHPLTWISHMTDVSLYGLNATGHHFSNLLLHLICAILLTGLIRHLLEQVCGYSSWFIPIMLAAAWAAHPCRVEVVAWVSERKEILCTAFTLAAAWCYVIASRRPCFHWVGLGVFILACLSKPIAVALPLALLFFPATNWRKLIPWFGVSLFMGVATLWLQKEGGHAALDAAHTPAYRLLYLPWRAMEYVTDLAGIPPRSLFRYPAERPLLLLVLSWAGLAMVMGTAWGKRKQWPLFTVGFIWFLAFFLPVSGLIPVSIYETADRYTYLPHIGLLLMMAEGLRRYSHRTLFIILAPLCLIWSLVTHQESRRWKDSLTLFRGELQINPRSLLAYIQYGHALLDIGDHEKAMRAFKQASDLDPLASIGPLNEGLLYEEIGKSREAQQAFQQAIIRQTQNGMAHHRLAVLLSQKGEHLASLKVLEEGLERHPDDLNLLNTIAQLFATKLDNPQQAISYYRKALTLSPLQPDLLQGLGLSLVKIGQATEGQKYLQKALQADPSRQHLKDYLKQLKE